MLRVSTMMVLVALAGCKPDQISTITLDGELIVSPALEDLDTKTVGVEHDFTLSVTALTADITLTNVDLNAIAGEGYWFADSWFNVLRDGVADDKGAGPVTIARDETVEIPFTYFPLQEGYHRVQVSFSSDNKEGEIQTEVRARADTPDAAVFPWTLDFGSVEPGDFGSEFVAIVNESALQLTISNLAFSDDDLLDRFSTNEPLPIVIEPQSEKQIEIRFEPRSDAAAYGNLGVFVGEVPIRSVRLRANDCAQGVPSAYDRDKDGFTTCGGDCDDNNAAINPGALEIIDGADNNCNGLADDGTSAYDDDGDGYCDDPAICLDPSVLPRDCNDGDALVNPGADEVLGDGIDNDCDGQVDGGTQDADGDGYTVLAGDCDPVDATVFPGARELPDGKDNDCDLIRDEETVLYDDDGDGFCEGMPSSSTPCTDGTALGDCNDVDDTTNPNAVELPDWRDNNCDGVVDEGTGNYDDDGDGYTENASPPDCDDDDPDIGPASLEVPGNGIDDDCNPSTPSGQAQ